MATIIAFGNQKGGAGKTTVTCLAENALSSPPFSARVFVADCDPQQSIIRRRLADQQITDDVPPYRVAFFSLAELQRDINRLDRENDFVFIDLPGRLDIARPADQQEITKFIQYIDFLFVPMTPGNYAMQSTVDYLRGVVKIAETRANAPRPLSVVGFLNMYEGGRTTDDRALVEEADNLQRYAKLPVLETRLQRYALFRGVDTFTTFYAPETTDRAAANFSAFLDELLKTIKWQRKQSGQQ